MEKNIRDCTGRLIESIRESRDYSEYRRRGQELLETSPAVFDRIMDLRRRKIELDSIDNEEIYTEHSERLERQFEELERIPEAEAFLEAEEAVMRSLQNIVTDVTREVALWVPEF